MGGSRLTLGGAFRRKVLLARDTDAEAGVAKCALETRPAELGPLALSERHALCLDLVLRIGDVPRLIKDELRTELGSSRRQ